MDRELEWQTYESGLAISCPRTAIRNIFVLALSLFLPTISKLAQQGLRGGCRGEIQRERPRERERKTEKDSHRKKERKREREREKEKGSSNIAQNTLDTVRPAFSTVSHHGCSC